MKSLDDETLNVVQHELEGTCLTLDAVIESHDLDVDPDTLEDRLLDGSNPIERSVCCGWWFTSAVLEFDDLRNGGVCEQCEPELFD